ncbi:hypothetical protein SAMN05660485_00439 [Blastococcus fimeti]|nr:hypothetical protein SAMN05660485_00439 [Blastococcus fimeti]
MTRRWTLRLAACLVAGAAVLTGCSEKQEAAQTLPTSSSAAPTEDALPPLGPEGFPVPAEARKRTPEGAVEFVRYFVGLTGYLAEHSLDPAPLLDLSQDCRSCSNIAESLAEDRAANYTYREYEFEFTEYGPALLDGETAEMGFTYVQGPVSVVDPTGAVVTQRSSGRSEEMQSGAILRWRSDLNSWVMTGLTVG